MGVPGSAKATDHVQGPRTCCWSSQAEECVQIGEYAAARWAPGEPRFPVAEGIRRVLCGPARRWFLAASPPNAVDRQRVEWAPIGRGSQVVEARRRSHLG